MRPWIALAVIVLATAAVCACGPEHAPRDAAGDSAPTDDGPVAMDAPATDAGGDATSTPDATADVPSPLDVAVDAPTDAGPPADGGADAGCGALPTFLDGFVPSRTLYVSAASGSDAADGLSPATALQSLRAAATRLMPGDEVRVAAGRYDCGVNISVQASAARPVWIRSYDGPLRAVLDCRGTQYGVTFANARFVALDGFEIGNTVADSHGVHLNSGGMLTNVPDHILVTHCHVHHCGLACLKVSHGTNVDVIDNELDHPQYLGANGAGQVLDMVGAHQVRVVGNRVHDVMDQPGIQAKGGSTDVRIDRNVLWNVAGGINLGGVTAPTVFFPPDADYEGLRVVATNNVIYAGSTAAAIWGCRDCVFANNSIAFAAPTQPVRLLSGATAAGGTSRTQNAQVVNNLFYFSGRPSDLLNATPGNDTGFTQSHNLFFWTGGAIASVYSDVPVGGAGIIVDRDPLLTAPDRGDLTLGASSPARGAGTPVAGVTDDARGACRGVWNIGAY